MDMSMDMCKPGSLGCLVWCREVGVDHADLEMIKLILLEHDRHRLAWRSRREVIGDALIADLRHSSCMGFDPSCISCCMSESCRIPSSRRTPVLRPYASSDLSKRAKVLPLDEIDRKVAYHLVESLRSARTVWQDREDRLKVISFTLRLSKRGEGEDLCAIRTGEGRKESEESSIPHEHCRLDEGVDGRCCWILGGASIRWRGAAVRRMYHLRDCWRDLPDGGRWVRAWARRAMHQHRVRAIRRLLVEHRPNLDSVADHLYCLPHECDIALACVRACLSVVAAASPLCRGVKPSLLAGGVLLAGVLNVGTDFGVDVGGDGGGAAGVLVGGEAALELEDGSADGSAADAVGVAAGPGDAADFAAGGGGSLIVGAFGVAAEGPGVVGAPGGGGAAGGVAPFLAVDCISAVTSFSTASAAVAVAWHPQLPFPLAPLSSLP